MLEKLQKSDGVAVGFGEHIGKKFFPLKLTDDLFQKARHSTKSTFSPACKIRVVTVQFIKNKVHSKPKLMRNSDRRGAEHAVRQ